MNNELNKKCHNCNGTGKQPTEKRLKKHPNINCAGRCYYCRGKGYRINNYGRDN